MSRFQPEQLHFLLEVLQLITDINGDYQIIHSLLRENLALLDDEMIAVLETFTVDRFAAIEREEQRFIAMIIGEFGNLIQEFPLGNRAVNMELSISCYNLAVQVLTIHEVPETWASIQNSLAIAYSERIRGDKAENLEKSIVCYESASEIYTKECFPKQWAMTQNNLANAYSDRILGDRSENLEMSIACYKSASEIYTKECFPKQWAMTQNNLANVYKDRIWGDRAENLERAILSYESALAVYTKWDFSVQWAMTQNNLANAYSDRIRGDRAENLERAILSYQLSLEVRNRADFPVQWAITQNNIANSYLNRIAGDKAENLERAILSYESALAVYTKWDFPVQWAMTQNNLANAYSQRMQGDRSKNLEMSIDCYGSSLEVRTPQSLPSDCLQSARNLGNVHFIQGNWQKAIDVYEIAMQAVETSRTWVANEQNRQQLLKDAISVYENAIQCAIKINDYRKAIEYTERIRSRQLVDLIGTKDVYPDTEIPAEIQKYLAEYEQLSHQIQQLSEHGSLEGDGIISTRNAVSLSHDNVAILALEAQKRELYLKIRAFDPAIAGQIAVEQIEFAAIQKLITNSQTAILIFYSTDDDTHIFILKQNQEPQLLTCPSQGWHEFQQWLIENWFKPYNNLDSSGWRVQMPKVLAEIADRLQLNQLFEILSSDIHEIVLVPHLLLHQIPFAALPICDGVLLGERFTIRSVPSCQILQYCQQRPVVSGSVQGIVEDANDNLLGARYEGEQIAALYDVSNINRLRGSTQATIANYRDILSRVNRLHSSHHAISRLDNPLESALILADGKITLGDLLIGKRYPELDEVFLSACETHLGQFTFTDDVVTLSTGFLCIGARSVISTLWSVDDLVTALFDIFYHQERRDGFNRAISLQSAQLRLLNLTGEEFKISHYPQLIEHVAQEIATLTHHRKELYQQKSTLDDRSQEWQDIAQTMKNLTQQIKSIESIPATLQRYCTMDRPFESPFYWAGFICQGMA